MIPTRLTVLLCAFFLSVVPARAEYFTIKNFQVTVTFDNDGEATFDEIITVEFSQPRHGIFRYIPYRSIVNGKTVDRLIRDVQVDGYKFGTSKENYNLVMKIGDPKAMVDGRQQYKIHYRVLNPLNFFDDHSEFYWNLLGDTWPVQVESFSFKVEFPHPISLAEDDVFCYTGVKGSQGKDVHYQVSPSMITGQTTRVFNPEEGLTLAVRIPEGSFQPMGTWAYFRERHGLLLAPLVFLFTGGLAFFMARNKRQTIMTEYFPPEGISPAVAGGFVDNSVDNHDILSLIPHLANKGYLRLEVGEPKGLFGRSEVTFIKLKEVGDDLEPFEKEFFEALFSFGDQVQLNSLKDQFYSYLSSVRSSIKSWIRDQGWYEADQRTMGCVTALGGFGAVIWGGYAIIARQNMDGLALIGAGIILFYLAGKFNKRTASGNETYRKLEGFRRFVKKAERPVIERLLKDDPSYYDKTMAFALAFGYLKEWNKHFEGLLTEPPSWYSSPYIYGTDLSRSWDSFSTSFPTEINQIGSVFSSSPSSSGSGGGGGGFSGGGSGGGGGGSW